MPISLKQMQYAVALARAGHFGRAASACAVSQPALSQQIQTLEELCGVSLFDRVKHSVRPTPFGETFVALAQATLDSAEALENFASGHQGRPDRPLRVGLIPTVAPYLLPRVLPALSDALPELAFVVSEDRTDALLTAVIEGSLDAVLIATEPSVNGPRLVSRTLFYDAFVLATSRKEKVTDPVALDDLVSERILLLADGHCFRDQTIAACRLDSAHAKGSFAATSLSTILELVADGQGITLLPQIALHKEANDPRLVIHPLARPGAGRELRLVWREATPFASVFELIADIVRLSAGPEGSTSGGRRA